MTECCCPPAVAQSTRTCPACASRTSPVDLTTVKALLTPAALRRLELVTFRFCPDAACEVVYTSESGQVFNVDDLRVPVWQKSPPGDRMLCYCFGETEREMAREIRSLGRTDALVRVRAHISEGRCACELRNPRGSCCLGDLTAAAARLEREVIS